MNADHQNVPPDRDAAGSEPAPAAEPLAPDRPATEHPTISHPTISHPTVGGSTASHPAPGARTMWPALSAQPAGGRRIRFSPRAAIVAVAAAAVLAAGAGAVFAASGQDAPPAGSGVAPAAGMHGGPGGRPGGPDIARALHGEFVIAADGGGTENRLLQTGEVTTVTEQSITVASSDGFTATYTVDEATVVDRGRQSLSDLAAGDTVTVVARASGDTATAIVIDDRATDGRPPGGRHGPYGQPS